jgi:hypothetical protein
MGHPGTYPQANTPQTWNQSVFPILIQSILGIIPVAPLNLLTAYPVLPDWLPELTLRNLRVGDARVTLRFRRNKRGQSTYEVLERHGSLRVIKQPLIESLTAGIWDRLGILTKKESEGRLRFPPSDNFVYFVTQHCRDDCFAIRLASP